NGRPYEGRRIRFSMLSAGRSDAYQIVQAHPSGCAATVYIDPAHPQRAVLEQRLRGTDFLPLVFSMPFNAVMLIGIMAVVESRLSRRRPGAVVAGFRVWDEGGITRVRVRAPWIAWAAGIAVTGGACFVAIFVLAFTPLRHSIAAVLTSWFAALVAGALVAL